MLVYLIILFTILPALELAVLIKVGTYIGVGNTILMIILTGAVGAALARAQGFAVLKKIQFSLNEGRMPTDEMLDGVLILIGGIVLLTPGFITDIIGLFLLIPLTRSVIKLWLKRRFSQRISTVNGEPSRGKPFKNYEDADYY